MSWGAVAGAAVGLVGGALSSRSAKSAANTQAAAARDAASAQLQAGRESNELQAAALRQDLLTQAPQYYSGNLALSALMGGMGLGPSVNRGLDANGRPIQQATGNNGNTFTNANGQTVDAGGNVITDNTYGIGDIYYGPSNEELAGAANQFDNTFNETFTGQDLYLDPSYQFRVNEGEKLLRARQAASGNRFSGQAMKDIVNYGQEAGSQEYSAANDRFLKNKALLYDRLSNLAGIGSAAGNAGTAATTTAAGNMGNTLTGATTAANNFLTSGAAATAAGQVGSTNALVGGVNNGLNNWYTMSYLRGNQGGSGGSNIWAPGFDGADGGWTGGH